MEKEKITVEDLKKNKIFKELEEETLREILEFITLREYKKGRIIFFEGDTGKFLYLIKKGKVEIYRKEGKEEKHIAVLGEGDFLGEMSIIEKEKRSASCRAIEDVEIMLFSKRNLEELIEKKPKAACKILFQIAKVLSKRLRSES